MADRYHDTHLLARFVGALEALAARSHEGLATKCDIDNLKEWIMATAREYYDQIKPELARQKASLDKVRADVTRLLAKIAAFENSPGPLSAADEVLWKDIRDEVKVLADDTGNVDELSPEPPTQ